MIGTILGVLAVIGFAVFLYKKMSAPKKYTPVIAPDEVDTGDQYPDVDELNRKKRGTKV
jgi:hypothetical protein